MEELLFVDEVAQRLRVTRKTVYDWMRDGKLEWVMVGGRRRITPAALAAFIESGTKAEKQEFEEKNATPRVMIPAYS